MSVEANTLLFEKAAELVDYFTNDKRSFIIESRYGERVADTIKTNDLEELLVVIHEMQLQKSLDEYDDPSEYDL